jgi:hypothetical protein
MTSAPRNRRWLQTRLRTIFIVVTVVAVWLGWELRFVQNRKTMRRWLNENEWGVMAAVNPRDAIVVQDFSNVTIPIWRNWMGDEPIALIALPDHRSKEREQAVRDLFPEATIAEEWQLVPRGGIVDAEEWAKSWQIDRAQTQP